jgi:hypothetical protein
MQDLAHEIVMLATGGARSVAIFGNWRRLGDAYEIRRVVRVVQPVHCFQLQVARLSVEDFELDGPDDYDPSDVSQQEWQTVLAFGTAASALMCAGESGHWRFMTTTLTDDATPSWRWVATFDTRSAAAQALSDVV